jgi:hypothetical protein
MNPQQVPPPQMRHDMQLNGAQRADQLPKLNLSQVKSTGEQNA